MTIAYFDCFSGASGDMLVGALIAAGADLEALRRDLAVLKLDGVELAARRVERQGVYATKFDVVVRGEVEGAAEEVGHAHDHGHHHPHDHEHDHHHHPHDHGHHHHHDHGDHDHPHHAHRTLGDVEALLQPLREPARSQAIAIFRRLAEAEAKVHGTTAPYVHFHEVGQDDAIADVVSVVLALEQLGVTEVHCSPLPLGHGMVRCAHGMMPVPVPAVVELMAGFPSYDNGEAGELVTPTGAAILTTLATRFGPPPTWSLRGVGYGAGTREGKRIPNMVRVMLGEPLAPEPGGGRIELAANIDDMSPQLYGPLTDKLLAAGALDVALTPTIMKKGRPGVILSVIAPEAARQAIEAVLFAETTTIGVRWHAIERTELEREWRTVSTPWGAVRVKAGRLGGQVMNVAPEFEDCREAAERAGVPVKDVWQEALVSARQEWRSLPTP